MKNLEISMREILNENKKIRHFKKNFQLLIVTNINLKSFGESVIRYVLEKELKVGIGVTCCKPYEKENLKLVPDFDEILIFYYENEIENKNGGQKELIFLDEILSNCSYIGKRIFYMSDAAEHSEIEQKISRKLYNHNVHEVKYFDLYFPNRGNYNYKIYDMRKYILCECVYNIEGFFLIAEAVLRYLRDKRHMYKKCLVLDCDNVLWGGTLEERGVNGVELDMLYPGRIYYNFQKFIKLLSQNGVIIALCSKNDESDVLNMLDSHPFMQIREKDIAAYRINWNNKADNILDISKELRIDVDDFVFVDDSPEEIGLVSLQFPSMTTILFDNDFKYNYKELFMTHAYFNLSNNTEEDAKRNEMYYAERMRKKKMKSMLDEKEYLKSLQFVLENEDLSEFNIERMIQLQIRTHRANLSSRIYSAKQLIKMGEEGMKATCYKLSDKYGDYGYVAFTISAEERSYLRIKDFYLSCRALGKNIEIDIVKDLLSSCKRVSAAVNIDYFETEKNKDFFQTFVKALRDQGVKVLQKEINHVLA